MNCDFLKIIIIILLMYVFSLQFCMHHRHELFYYASTPQSMGAETVIIFYFWCLNLRSGLYTAL